MVCLGMGYGKTRGFLTNHSVMVTALNDDDGIIRCFVDEPVLPVDAAGPVSRPGMLEWLWITHAFEWVTLDFLDQCVDPFQQFLVRCLPIKVILPRFLSP